MPSNALDPFDLARFVSAQADSYESALAEIEAGEKTSHWMWFIFPQLNGLGGSSMARRYAIHNLDEAQAYLAHPILGPRLTRCAEATLAVRNRSAHDIFGSPDDLKLRSCATLFSLVSAADSPFHRILAKYYGDRPDVATLELLRAELETPR